MVSITSIISFAIVLLAASSYSAPIDVQPNDSKLNVNIPKEKPVGSQWEWNNESTSVSSDHQGRSSEEKDSDELTTETVARRSDQTEEKDSDEITTDAFTRSPRGSESYEMTTDAFTRSPRGFEGKDSYDMTTDAFTRSPRGSESSESYEATTDAFTRSPRGSEATDSYDMTTDAFTRPPRSFEGKDSDEMTTEVFTQSPRSFDEYTYPSSTEENPKRNVQDFYPTLESSTQFNQRAIPPLLFQDEIESSSFFPVDQKKSIDEEPSSSVQSFGKSTGLLNDQSNENVQSAKVVSIIPGKVSETEIFSKQPSKTSIVIDPEQLSQVQH